MSLSQKPTGIRQHPNLEPGFLYAILLYSGDLASWNWAFFVLNPAISPIGADGTMFFVDDDSDTASTWKFEMVNKDIVDSPLTVAVIRLGDVSYLGSYDDVVGRDGLQAMFRTVKIPELEDGSTTNAEFSSRIWFLDAIYVLNDCGVVNCDDVWLLEREIRRYAFTSMDGYLQDKGWSAVYIAEHCA